MLIWGISGSLARMSQSNRHQSQREQWARSFFKKLSHCFVNSRKKMSTVSLSTVSTVVRVPYWKRLPFLWSMSMKKVGSDSRLNPMLAWDFQRFIWFVQVVIDGLDHIFYCSKQSQANFWKLVGFGTRCNAVLIASQSHHRITWPTFIRGRNNCRCCLH